MGEMLEVVVKDREAGADRQVVVLQNGFVHLVNFIPPDLQQRFVDEMRDLGVSEGGFFELNSLGIMRMHLGLQWNLAKLKWEPRGMGQPALDLPKLFQDMYREGVQRANRELTRPQHKKRKFATFPDKKVADLGVVDFCPISTSVSLQQTLTESKEALDGGFAVMGVCLGDSCDLTYSMEPPSASRKPKALRMESGDAYLFGGDSRPLWIGVSKVLPRSAPPSLRLLPGLLNLSLRVS